MHDGVFAGRWRAMGVLAVAQFMIVLDLTVVNVALPKIQPALGFSDVDLSWIINAYNILFGGLLLLGGRLADLFGRRTMFQVGLAIFVLSSLVAGIAGSELLLIAARAVQGLGAALLAPAALSIVIAIFPDELERTKALAIWGSLAGVGGTAGVFLGGILVDALSWRWIFFINIPVGLVAGVAALRLVPPMHAPTKRRRYDLPGATAITAAVMLLVYAIVSTDRHAWGSSTTILLLAGAAALVIAFVFAEARSREPLVPLRIFRLRSLVAAQGGVLFVAAAFQPVFFFLTLYMQQVMGYSPFKTGAAFVPIGLSIIFGTVVAQVVIPRVGVKPPEIVGATLLIVGLVLFAGVDSDPSFIGDVLPGSVVAGLGVGFSFAPVLLVGSSEVDSSESGLASGIIQATLQVGAALGIAILVTVAASHTSDQIAGGASQLAATVSGFRRAFDVAVGIAVLNLLVEVFALPNFKPSAPSRPDRLPPEPSSAAPGLVTGGDPIA